MHYMLVYTYIGYGLQGTAQGHYKGVALSRACMGSPTGQLQQYMFWI